MRIGFRRRFFPADLGQLERDPVGGEYNWQGHGMRG